MIDPKCDRCGEELVEFGAIVIGPPLDGDYDGCQLHHKYHLCLSCWHEFVPWLRAWPNKEGGR